jgi:hypothetical protein
MRLARRAAGEGAARVLIADIRTEAELRLGAAAAAYTRARRTVHQLEELRRGGGRCA